MVYLTIFLCGIELIDTTLRPWQLGHYLMKQEDLEKNFVFIYTQSGEEELNLHSL